MVAVRRRTRRRRTDPPIRRKTLTVMLVCFAIVFVLVAVPSIREPVLSWVRHTLTGKRPPAEVVALGVAGLVLVYLIPGVEDKVLTTLGIRKRRRTRNSHR